MTKEQLREYKAIKKELQTLEVLHRRIERTGDAELTERYEALCHKANEELAAIENAIKGLPPTKRDLMRLRYIEGMPWPLISRRLNYSWQHLHRMHASALQEIRDL